MVGAAVAALLRIESDLPAKAVVATSTFAARPFEPCGAGFGILAGNEETSLTAPGPYGLGRTRLETARGDREGNIPLAAAVDAAHLNDYFLGEPLQ